MALLHSNAFDAVLPLASMKPCMRVEREEHPEAIHPLGHNTSKVHCKGVDVENNHQWAHMYSSFITAFYVHCNLPTFESLYTPHTEQEHADSINLLKIYWGRWDKAEWLNWQRWSEEICPNMDYKRTRSGQVKQSSSYEGGWGKGVEVGASHIARLSLGKREIQWKCHTLCRQCPESVNPFGLRGTLC